MKNNQTYKKVNNITLQTYMNIDVDKYIESRTKKEIIERLATCDDYTLQVIVRESLKKQYSNMMDIITSAVKMGVNINRMGLIKAAIIDKNLPLFLLCIKENVDLITKDETLLHLAVKSCNIFAIKYLSKKLDINELDFQLCTPLDIACINKKTTIIDVLIQCGASRADVAAENLIDEIRDFYHNGGTVFTEEINKTTTVLEKLISNKIIKSKDFIQHIIPLMTHADKTFLPMIIKHYPQILKEHSFYGTMNMLSIAITTNRHDTVQNILDAISEEDLLSDITENNDTQLHRACNIGNIITIENLLKKSNKLLNFKNDNGKSLISYTMGINKKYGHHNNDNIIAIIRKLVSLGCEFDNEDGIIFSAVQCFNYEIVNEMINLGCEVNCGVKDLKVDDFYCPLSNNDILGFAVKCNKLNVCKLLVEKGAKFFFMETIEDNKKYKLYTCILLAIMHMYTDVLEYLVELNEIKQTLDSMTKQNLLKRAVSYGCSDDKLLQLFAPPGTLISQETISKIRTNLNKKSCDAFFELSYTGYEDMNDDERNEILERTYIFLFILIDTIQTYRRYGMNVFFRNKSGEYSKCIKKIFRLFDNFLDTLDSSDNIKEIIRVIHIRTQITKKLLRKLYDGMLDLYNHRDEVFSSKEKEDRVIVSITGNSHEMIDETEKFAKLESFPDFIKHMIDFNDIEENVEMYVCKQLNNQTLAYLSRIKKVGSKLERLSWPFRVAHYTKMYNLLSDVDRSVYQEMDRYLTATIDSGSLSEKIEYRVMKLKSNVPNRWFEYYGKNIGKEGKTDDFHMFPFVFDEKVNKYPCVVRIVQDPTDMTGTGMDTMIYFYGMMIYQKTGKMLVGCYEYFINSRKMLFHRIFKEMHKLPDDVVVEVNGKKF